MVKNKIGSREEDNEFFEVMEDAVPVWAKDVTPEDVPFLLSAAAACHKRAAMAWSDESRARWAKLAKWNEDVAESAEASSR